MEMVVITTRYMTDEEKSKAIKMKEKGCSASEIARLLNRSPSTIERLLNKRGFINVGNKIMLTEDEKEKIAYLYKEKRMNSVEVWEHSFKDRCGQKAIELYIKNQGLSRGKGRGSYNKTLKHNYFKKIDGANKAYLLGNIVADGSVSSGKAIRFEVSSKDREILDFAKQELCANTDIHTYQREGRNDTCVLYAASIDIVRDLEVYNVVKQKQSKDFGIPKIPSEYMRDFIRGYFDGDGSIYLYKKGRYRVSICGTYTFIKELEDIMIELGILKAENSNIVDMSKYGINIFHLRISDQKSVDDFAKYIYRDEAFSLKRKRELFQKHINRHVNTEITCKQQVS